MEFRYLAYFWYQLNFRPLIRFLGHHFDEVETQIILGFVSLKTLTFHLISLHIYSFSLYQTPVVVSLLLCCFFSWLLFFLSWHPRENLTWLIFLVANLRSVPADQRCACISAFSWNKSNYFSTFFISHDNLSTYCIFYNFTFIVIIIILID